MSIYMKVPFAKGDVTASGYAGWVELQELSFSIDRDISMEMGSLQNLPKSQARFSFFRIVKKTEDSSGGFIDEAITGMSGHRVEIAVVEAGESPKEYARYVLDDVHLAKFAVHATTGAPLEIIDLSYSKIEARYTPHSPANKGMSKITATHDLKS